MNDLQITGIKCDNCAYTDEAKSWGTTVEEILRTNDSYLNKPCPECGASLLTPADHKVMIRLVRIMRVAEKISNWLAKLPFKCCQKYPYNIHMDGTGKVEFEKR